MRQSRGKNGPSRIERHLPAAFPSFRAVPEIHGTARAAVDRLPGKHHPDPEHRTALRTTNADIQQDVADGEHRDRPGNQRLVPTRRYAFFHEGEDGHCAETDRHQQKAEVLLPPDDFSRIHVRRLETATTVRSPNPAAISRYSSLRIARLRISGGSCSDSPVQLLRDVSLEYHRATCLSKPSNRSVPMQSVQEIVGHSATGDQANLPLTYGLFTKRTFRPKQIKPPTAFAAQFSPTASPISFCRQFESGREPLRSFVNCEMGLTQRLSCGASRSPAGQPSAPACCWAA